MAHFMRKLKDFDISRGEEEVWELSQDVIERRTIAHFKTREALEAYCLKHGILTIFHV